MKKNSIILVLILISGLILGGYIGTLAAIVPTISFLSYGKTIGLTEPFILDLEFLYLEFGFSINFSIAGVLGMILSGIIYNKYFKE